MYTVHNRAVQFVMWFMMIVMITISDNHSVLGKRFCRRQALGGVPSHAQPISDVHVTLFGKNGVPCWL